MRGLLVPAGAEGDVGVGAAGVTAQPAPPPAASARFMRAAARGAIASRNLM